jgi:hypothetical protein
MELDIHTSCAVSYFIHGLHLSVETCLLGGSVIFLFVSYFGFSYFFNNLDFKVSSCVFFKLVI